ncbi:MAG: Gx transporter family protein [Ruminococcus sp.]|nr:Gx transporter family protein [Ruminococcus sp.]
MKTKRLAELSMLTAAALIMFIVELQLPDLSAIQGVKLGLANIFTVYAVYRFTPKETFLLVLTRILLGSIFAGKIMAMIYSLAGGMLCLLGMLLLKKVIPINYMWLCSIFGAIFHNTGQIAAAIAITRSFAVVANYPILLVTGCIAGAFTGLCAQFVVQRLTNTTLKKEKDE